MVKSSKRESGTSIAGCSVATAASTSSTEYRLLTRWQIAAHAERELGLGNFHVIRAERQLNIEADLARISRPPSPQGGVPLTVR